MQPSPPPAPSPMEGGGCGRKAMNTEEGAMTENQRAVLESSPLELLDELKDGDLLVRDTECMAIRGLYYCYVLTKEGYVQNIDYHYRTMHGVGQSA